MSFYDTIPVARLKKSMFPLKEESHLTLDQGSIVPFFYKEMLPGDIFKLYQSNFIRVQPMVAAPFTSIRYYAEFWFCPTRVLMQKFFPAIVDAWQTFILGGPNGNGQNEAGQTPTLPLWIPNKNNVKLAGFTVDNQERQYRKTGMADAKGSLWDYFGFPTNQGFSTLNDEGKKTVGGETLDYSDFVPLAFPKIQYNLVWNNFKRNENIEPSVPLDDENIKAPKWKRGRYTSALPFQQRGDPVALPISGIGDISFSNNLDGQGYSNGVEVGLLYGQSGFKDVSAVSASQSSPERLVLTADGLTEPVGGRLYSKAVNSTIQSTVAQLNSAGGHVDFNQAVSCNISQLRLAVQTQRFMERTARGGVRYIEGLKSFFGIAPSEAVLQLPQFVGGMIQNIIINEVLQTSESAATPQGNISGRGISAGGEYVGTVKAKEHGYLMGICWIKPDLYYSSQGIPKEMLRRSRYDFYWPQFAHLSEQPILKAELYANINTMTPEQLGKGSAGLFGYTGKDNEYRMYENRVCGEMRDTFKYWHLARSFESAPELNADFINCQPRKDIFAVRTEDEFMIDTVVNIKAFRPMPLESNPGLLDHF